MLRSDVRSVDTEDKAIQQRDSPATRGARKQALQMPTVAATGNLSARLRIAQGRRPDSVVEVPENPVTQPAEPRQWLGDGDQCSWSVMQGQRCNRAAVAGDTL